MAEPIFPELGALSSASRAELARHEMRGPWELEPGEDAFNFALFQSTGVALEPGNRLSVVLDAAFYDALIDAIDGASDSVHLLTYMWRPGRASERVTDALTRARSRGVACRIVVDPVGSEQTSGHQDFDVHVEHRLRQAGCEVHYYRPLARKLIGRLLARTHQKIALIDGRIGFTGGTGLGDSWLDDGTPVWRDTDVCVEGPAVARMQVAFARTWQESGGGLLPRAAFPSLPHCGSTPAAYLSSDGRLGVTDGERLMRLAFSAARQRLWIANAYFSPMATLVDVLETKRRQGVDVRVLLPGPEHDVPLIRAAQRALYPRLHRAGIRLYEFQPAMMHAKTVLVDDWLGFIGSQNLDPVSLNKLLEGTVVFSDPELAARLEHSFLRDLEFSREIRGFSAWRPRPLGGLARKLALMAGADR